MTFACAYCSERVSISCQISTILLWKVVGVCL